MKRLLVFLAIVACALTFSVKAISLPEVTDHEKVTVYMFRGSGCGHCYDALTFFYQNLGKYSDYIEFKAYEVWQNENNTELKFDIEKQFNEHDPEHNPVPYIVVGDSYTLQGFGASSGNAIIEAALNEYQNPKYKDVVAKTIKDKKYKVTAETLEEAATAEGINASTIAKQDEEQSKEKGKYDALIIVAIFVAVIGGVVALMFSNRKND